MAAWESSSVDDLMRTWPATIRVFLDFGMACPGCPIAPFHTIDDACLEHGKSRDAFVAALSAVISAKKMAVAG